MGGDEAVGGGEEGEEGAEDGRKPHITTRVGDAGDVRLPEAEEGPEVVRLGRWLGGVITRSRR